MVQERIEIVVTDRGTRRVKRNIRSIGASAQAAGTGVNFLRNGLIALGAGLTVRGLLRTADAFTEVQNALRLVTNGTQELNNVTDELLGISNRTRTDLETNADFFRRLTLATRELGVSQQKLLGITESINQAIQVSGAKTKEASNGLIQLAQGLSSGGLRGDELRSVLEQLPRVADVISKQLGVTRGELRALGAEFRITSDVIVDGFAAAADELEAEFGTTVPTVDQSLKVLNNSFTVTIGRLNETLGVTELFSRAIIGLALNLDALVASLTVAGAAFGGLKLGVFVQTLANARAAQSAVTAAVTAGNAVLIESAEAETAKLALAARSAAAQASATRQQQLANFATQRSVQLTAVAAEAEVARIKTLSLTGGSLAGLAKAEEAVARSRVALTAAESNVAAARVANAKATDALAAANTRYNTAVSSGTARQGLFATAISATTARVKALTVALLKNPLTFLVTAVTIAIGALFALRNEIKFGENQIASLGDVTNVVFGNIQTSVNFVIGKLLELVGVIDGIEVFDIFAISFEDFVRGVATGVDSVLGLFVGIRRAGEEFGKKFLAIFGALGPAISGLFETLGRAGALALEGEFSAAAQIAKVAKSDFERAGDEAFRSTGKTLGEAFKEGFDESNVANDLLDSIIASAEQNRLDELRDSLGGDGDGGGDGERLGAVEVIIQKLQEEGRLLQLNNAEREVETRLVREIEKLRSQGVQISEDQTQAIREQLQLNQQIAQTLAFDEAAAGLREQGVLLALNNEERERESQFLQLKNQIAGQGGQLTDLQEEELRLLIAANAELERQAELKAAQVETEQRFTQTIADLEQQAIFLRQSNTEQEINNQLLQLKNQITGENGAITPDQEEQLRLLVEQNNALQRQAEILNEIVGPQERYKQGVMDLQSLLDDGRISQDEFNASVRDLKIAALEAETDLASGLSRGLLKIEKQLNDLASTAERVVVEAFGELKNALVDFARTGELSFEGLINTILDGLAELAVQSLLKELFAGLGGAAGIGGAVAGLFSGTAASGGSVSSNQTQLVGEKGPELFTPPGPGNITPAGQTAAMIAPSVNVEPPQVNVNVVNVQDPDEVVDAIGSRNGEQAIMNVIRRHRKSIRNDLA